MAVETIPYGVTRKADEAKEVPTMQVCHDSDADAELVKSKAVAIIRFSRLTFVLRSCGVVLRFLVRATVASTLSEGVNFNSFASFTGLLSFKGA